MRGGGGGGGGWERRREKEMRGAAGWYSTGVLPYCDVALGYQGDGALDGMDSLFVHMPHAQAGRGGSLWNRWDRFITVGGFHRRFADGGAGDGR